MVPGLGVTVSVPTGQGPLAVRQPHAPATSAAPRRTAAPSAEGRRNVSIVYPLLSMWATLFLGPETLFIEHHELDSAILLHVGRTGVGNERLGLTEALGCELSGLEL